MEFLPGFPIYDAMKNGFPTPHLNVMYNVSQDPAKAPSSAGTGQGGSSTSGATPEPDDTKTYPENMAVFSKIIKDQAQELKELRKVVKTMGDKLKKDREVKEAKDNQVGSKKVIGVKLAFSPSAPPPAGADVHVDESDDPVLIEHFFPAPSFVVSQSVQREVEQAQEGLVQNFAKVLGDKTKGYRSMKALIANTAARLGWFEEDFKIAMQRFDAYKQAIETGYDEVDIEEIEVAGPQLSSDYDAQAAMNDRVASGMGLMNQSIGQMGHAVGAMDG